MKIENEKQNTTKWWNGSDYGQITIPPQEADSDIWNDEG